MSTGHLDASKRSNSPSASSNGENPSVDNTSEADDLAARRTLIKRMKVQIWAGTLIGFFIALSIGAAFIAVVSKYELFGTESDS